MFPQKRTAFSSSVLPFPPMILQPGSCQAARVEAALSHPVHHAPGTPEWRAEQEEKQRAYERQRREWRKLVGIVSSY